MPLDLTWTTDPADLTRVARVRLQTYRHAENGFAQMLATTNTEHASGECEFLLATDGTNDIGTTTAWSFNMHSRRAVFPCQGVAWVGTIKTARRRGDEGVATRLMHATLARAREREFVVTALMPFRASFYQHFGYGLAERRTDWTIPISLLPRGKSDGFTFATPADHADIHAAREQQARTGQCDLTRSNARWNLFHTNDEPNGFTVVHRAGGTVRGWMWLKHFHKDGRDVLHVADASWESPDALRRQLEFLSTLRDQYASVLMSLPTDLPLTRLLSEPQVPHRLVNHPVAEPRVYTRMQVRILDHARFLSGLHWPAEVTGHATIAVRECEGTESKFRLDVDAGHATVSASTREPDVSCPDHVWASVVTGDLSATSARHWGLLHATDAATRLLDALSEGPTPFSNEYF